MRRAVIAVTGALILVASSIPAHATEQSTEEYTERYVSCIMDGGFSCTVELQRCMRNAINEELSKHLVEKQEEGCWGEHNPCFIKYRDSLIMAKQESCRHLEDFEKQCTAVHMAEICSEHAKQPQ